MRRQSSVLRLVVPILLILFQTGRCDAELLHVVSPSAYADKEASGGGSNEGSTGRFQQVFPASDFQSLSGTGTITELVWRPDGTRTTPFQGTYRTITIRFSTTLANPGNLSMTFADNIGSDELVVLDATDFAMSSQNLGPVGGPKEFDMVYAFQTPFEYDPSQGNLLMDMTWTHEGQFSWDFVDEVGPGGQFIFSADAEASVANGIRVGGFVTRFSVVPEPSTAILWSLGLVAVGFGWWRKRKG